MARRSIETKYVRRLKRGDLEAFTKVYEFYKDSIYFFALSIVKNRADAQDVVQETFIQVASSIHNLQKETSFHAWINSIAYNQSMRVFRRTKNHVGLEEDVFLDTTFVSADKPDDILYQKEVVYNVQREIERLPLKFIQVAQLYYLNELSVREISEILLLPQSTVRDRIQRIQRKLQENLSTKGYKPKRFHSTTGMPIICMAIKGLVDKYQMSEQTAKALQIDVIHNVKGILSITGGSGVGYSALASWKVLSASIGILGVTTFGVLSLISENQKGSSIAGVPLGMHLDTEGIAQDEKIKPKHLALDELVIGEVSYDKKLTKGVVQVSAQLIKEVNAKDIYVSIGEKFIPFDILDNKIVFAVESNGEYTIHALSDEAKVAIQNIDKDLPELVGVDYYSDHLQVYIQDVKGRFDYSQSYALFNGAKYSITNEGKIFGNFSESFTLYMYDRIGNTIEYTIRHE